MWWEIESKTKNRNKKKEKNVKRFNSKKYHGKLKMWKAVIVNWINAFYGLADFVNLCFLCYFQKFVLEFPFLIQYCALILKYIFFCLLKKSYIYILKINRYKKI